MYYDQQEVKAEHQGVRETKMTVSVQLDCTRSRGYLDMQIN